MASFFLLAPFRNIFNPFEKISFQSVELILPFAILYLNIQANI